MKLEVLNRMNSKKQINPNSQHRSILKRIGTLFYLKVLRWKLERSLKKAASVTSLLTWKYRQIQILISFKVLNLNGSTIQK